MCNFYLIKTTAALLIEVLRFTFLLINSICIAKFDLLISAYQMSSAYVYL